MRKFVIAMLTLGMSSAPASAVVFAEFDLNNLCNEGCVIEVTTERYGPGPCEGHLLEARYTGVRTSEEEGTRFKFINEPDVTVMRYQELAAYIHAEHQRFRDDVECQASRRAE